jgi:hypothetical protein
VYQGQKVDLFLPSLSFLAEAQPRLENRRGQKALKAQVHIKFFRRLHKLQSKRHHWKNCIYHFQIDKFISTLIIFFNSICYQLTNKTRNLLFAIQLFIYISSGDRTIIGFVGLVVNLLNRPIDGAPVQRPEKSSEKNYFSSAFENEQLPFSLRVPKN